MAVAKEKSHLYGWHRRTHASDWIQVAVPAKEAVACDGGCMRCIVKKSCRASVCLIVCACARVGLCVCDSARAGVCVCVSRKCFEMELMDVPPPS